jgi:hypothetical protein
MNKGNKQKKKERSKQALIKGKSRILVCLPLKIFSKRLSVGRGASRVLAGQRNREGGRMEERDRLGIQPPWHFEDPVCHTLIH